MKTSFTKSLLYLVATLALTVSAEAQTPDAAERKKLIGTWEGWLVQGDGSQQSQRQQRISEMVITADRISAKEGRGSSMGQGTYKLGAAGSVKTLDATGIASPVQAKFYLGIYQLDGDTLRWCSGNDKAKVRPAAFKTNTGNGHFLMILTRKK